MAKDLYEILGVSKSVSKDELKKAYRKLAVKYHPDKNPGDEEAEKRFKEISAAYDILKDDEKRAAYDQYGEAAFTGGGGQQGFGGGFDFSGSSFRDIFEDLFGGMGGNQQSAASNLRGADLRYNLEVSLEEAHRGGSKTIKVPSYVACDTCDASGSASKKEPEACSVCGGSGRMRVQQGFFTLERTCHACGGVGTTIQDPCGACSGQGRVRKTRTLSVNIPEGVEDGTRIRITGEGEAGVRGGEKGDLYLFVSLKRHEIYERDGADIHCQVPLAMTTAALGGSIEVPTIDGSRARVTIPEGTQTGRKFRLKGKGLNVMRRSGVRGDMYVHAFVETPVQLTKKQKELLQEFGGTCSDKNNPESEGFIDKIKNFFAEL